MILDAVCMILEFFFFLFVNESVLKEQREEKSRTGWIILVYRSSRRGAVTERALRLRMMSSFCLFVDVRNVLVKHELFGESEVLKPIYPFNCLAV